MDYRLKLADGSTVDMLNMELATIESSTQQPPQWFRIQGGLLEKIIDDNKHPARRALTWQNGFVGKRTRNVVVAYSHLRASNAPLALHPEILDEVVKYVFIPNKVVDEYRCELQEQSD